MKSLSNKEMAAGLETAPARISEWEKRGMPMTSIEAATAWRRVHAPPRSKRVAKRSTLTQDKPSSLHPVPKGDDWQSRLERTKLVERQIFDSISTAIDQGDVTLLARLQSARAAALKEIRDAEKMEAESELEAGSVLPVDRVRQLLDLLVRPLRDALDKLPLNERTNCNPEHPEIAEKALTEWRDRLLETGHRLCGELFQNATAEERARHPFRPVENQDQISHPVSEVK